MNNELDIKALELFRLLYEEEKEIILERIKELLECDSDKFICSEQI